MKPFGCHSGLGKMLVKQTTTCTKTNMVIIKSSCTRDVKLSKSL